jgi:hypothetical protein
VARRRFTFISKAAHVDVQALPCWLRDRWRTYRQTAHTRDSDCRHDGSGHLCLVCSGYRELF